MKVLFAVNNDNISNAIVKKYQKDYREIVSYKNVYYFNAILKELQNDKTYDRIVISEDLEPFANNNYDTIDKFLFEKLDKISDEATKVNGENIEIILICADRRSKSDDMLNKIFGIGIYNALIGEERSIDSLCRLMNQPRNKKEAKIAYRIDGNSVGYQAEDENNVSEAEVQNILAHYKRLGRDEDKYVDSFNNIVSQYTDAQLKIIIRYLPMNVKAVLEERSPKYQELSTFAMTNNSSNKNGKYVPQTAKSLKADEKIKVKMLKNEQDPITKPIVIPSTLNNKKISKISNDSEKNEEKIEISDVDEEVNEVENIETVKKGRGRPRKNPIQENPEEIKPKRGRGRPKKEVEPEQAEDNAEDIGFDLFNMNSETDSNENTSKENEAFDDTNFFGLVEDKENNIEIENKTEPEDEFDMDLFNLDTEKEDEPIEEQNKSENDKEDEDVDLFNIEEQESTEENNNLRENTSIEPTIKTQSNLNTILTSKKKIVSFVGTTKNGTSFVVNNLALMLSSMNISTAILDTTKSKNSYYIYTNDDDRLRTIAEQCINNLENGIANGIDVNKNCTVYTQIPGQEQKTENIDKILSVLLEKHDIVLIDADFDTQLSYFESSQEIYLVQSMDVLTIQPLTAFLRNLKSKGILKEEKLKVILNKWQKVGGLSEKVLIGGMSSYNDPAMSFMTELFDKNSIKYCKIPFELQNNVKYLESLVNCQISLRGYTKQLLANLNELANMVYPLLNGPKYAPLSGKKNHKMHFSDETNSTLNKMKNNY